MAKITMKDVAKHANVSIATVSNVLNNISNKTTEATRIKVMASVKELHYKTGISARSLSIDPSNLIGLILPEIYENSTSGSILKGNPFYSELISGIEYQSRILGYDLIMSCKSSVDHIKALVEKHLIDGIAIVGDYPESFWKELLTLTIPTVLVDNKKKSKAGVYNIGINDELGAYLATKHLIALGHEKIALGSGPVDESEANERRLAGYRMALKEGGLDYAQCPIITEEVSYRGGVLVGHKLLKDYRDVTAIFAVSDVMALGIIKTMSQFGQKIPEDLSVVGFDNLSMCQYVTPSLTTIHQDIYKKGIEVANVLIQTIEGKKQSESQVLPVELIVRDTTKRRFNEKQS